MKGDEQLDALVAERLRAVLTDESSPYQLEQENPHAAEVRDLLVELCRARDELEGAAKSVREALERSLPAVRGADVSFNGVGLLQSAGSAIDQQAILFYRLRDLSQKALRRYFANERAS